MLYALNNNKSDCSYKYNAYMQKKVLTRSLRLRMHTLKTNARLGRIPLSEDDVMSILKSLDTSKATGPDGISAKVLKETAVSITSSLTKLISLSFQLNKMPQAQKQVINVLPIYKKGDQSVFSNYCPVSLLPVSAKVCEKVVFKCLFNYHRDNHIKSVHQSGFIPGDFTMNQLVFLHDLF